MSAKHTFYSTILSACCMWLPGCDGSSQSPQTRLNTPSSARAVEAGCGQCLFDLPGEGCTLAVRFDGNAYYVTGSSIDDHGDAHAADGLCNVVRPAEALGRIENRMFIAERIVLTPSSG